MSDFWVGHFNSIVIFLFVLSAIVLSNLYYLRPLSFSTVVQKKTERSRNSDYYNIDDDKLDYVNSNAEPFVSVLVPARNEELNIRNCVESILGQDYPRMELIVLDDCSEDGTGAILNEIAMSYRGAFDFKVIEGEKLPPVWLGKPRACHRLSERAAGELLLFVDADTVLEKDAVKTAVQTMVYGDYDLLSLMPCQKTVTFAEKLVVPVVLWSIMFFLPLFLSYRLKKMLPAAAIGQFMLFRANVYRRLGGHKAVMDEVVDDLALARLYKGSNRRWGIFNGVGLLSCRMYRNTAEVIEGFSKNLFGVFNYRIITHIFIWLWVTNVFFLPVLVLAGAGLEYLISGSSEVFPLAVLRPASFAVIISLFIWLTVNLNFRIPLYMTLFYPLTVLSTSLIAFLSLFRHLRGTKVWKGRLIEGKSIKWL